MGEKRKKKKREREKAIVKMERRKKKVQKMSRLRFFYSMKSYNSFSFVKSYCSTLTI